MDERKERKYGLFPPPFPPSPLPKDRYRISVKEKGRTMIPIVRPQQPYSIHLPPFRARMRDYHQWSLAINNSSTAFFFLFHALVPTLPVLFVSLTVIEDRGEGSSPSIR